MCCLQKYIKNTDGPTRVGINAYFWSLRALPSAVTAFAGIMEDTKTAAGCRLLFLTIHSCFYIPINR